MVMDGAWGLRYLGFTVLGFRAFRVLGLMMMDGV